MVVVRVGVNGADVELQAPAVEGLDPPVLTPISGLKRHVAIEKLVGPHSERAVLGELLRTQLTPLQRHLDRGIWGFFWTPGFTFP